MPVVKESLVPSLSKGAGFVEPLSDVAPHGRTLLAGGPWA